MRPKTTLDEALRDHLIEEAWRSLMRGDVHPTNRRAIAKNLKLARYMFRMGFCAGVVALGNLLVEACEDETVSAIRGYRRSADDPPAGKV